MSSPPTTIPALIDVAAEGDPDRTALIVDGNLVTFGAFAKRSREIADGLRANGIGAGDIVLIWLPNEAAWLETFIACARIGAIAFAVNLRFRDVELADILERTRARAIVYRPRFRDISYDDLYDSAAARARWRADVEVVVGGDRRRGAVAYGSLAESATLAMRTPAPDAGAILFTTSGTTSRPKFVLHSHFSIVRHACDVARSFGMTADDAVMLQALPFSGVFGFCQAMAALAARRSSMVPAYFDGAEAATLIQEFQVTHFNATDEMLSAMVEAAPAPDRYRSLRLVGAASFNQGAEALARIARDAAIPVVGLYGMSELQALYARRALDDPDDIRFLAGGRPVSAQASVRCRNPDTGVPASGDGGELECAGPALFSGYYGDEAATAAALTDDGFVRTGDFGRTAADGSFTFESRIGDTLRLGGYLVNPAEIADFIASLPEVAACQVVGVSAAGRGRAAAFVIAETPGGIDPESVIAACRKGLAPFKVPHIVHEVDAFPVVHSANGLKIQRGELRRMAQEHVELNC